MTNLAVCFNSENNALSEWDNMPFFGGCLFKGRQLLFNSLGVFEVGGGTDNGTAINPSVTTGKLDFGSQQRKRNRVSKVYVEALKTGDGLNLTVSDDNQAATYANTTARGVMAVYPFKVGRGLDGNRLQLQIQGDNLTALTIRSIELELDEIRRRAK